MEERKSIFENENFGKNLINFQKIIFFGALAASILVFVYSLIFMTPFSSVYQIDGQFLYSRMEKFGLSKIYGLESKGNVSAYIYSLSSGNDIGMNLAYFTYFAKNDLQTFNKWLFAFGFFSLIASLLPFVYASQKRKIYYKTNYILNPIVATFNLYVGVHFLIQLISNQILVWKQDYQLINAYESYLENNEATVIKTFYSQSDSNAIFIIGYVIAVLVIAFAIGELAITLIKYKYLKKQPKIDLSKVRIHE